jgi:hypothetical protein
MFLTAINAINEHIKINNIKTSKNLFLKLFIWYNNIFSSNKNNQLYYLDIRLSKYSSYLACKDFGKVLSVSCSETSILILTLYKKKALDLFNFLMDSGEPRNTGLPLNLMASFLPMLLPQKSKPIKAIQKPINPLLHDSDDDENVNSDQIHNDLGVE